MEMTSPYFRSVQASLVFFTAVSDTLLAESPLRQSSVNVRHKLCIEQRKAARAQPFHH